MTKNNSPTAQELLHIIQTSTNVAVLCETLKHISSLDYKLVHNEEIAEALLLTVDGKEIIKLLKVYPEKYEIFRGPLRKVPVGSYDYQCLLAYVLLNLDTDPELFEKITHEKVLRQIDVP